MISCNHGEVPRLMIYPPRKFAVCQQCETNQPQWPAQIWFNEKEKGYDRNRTKRKNFFAPLHTTDTVYACFVWMGRFWLLYGFPGDRMVLPIRPWTKKNKQTETEDRPAATKNFTRKQVRARETSERSSASYTRMLAPIADLEGYHKVSCWSGEAQEEELP